MDEVDNIAIYYLYTGDLSLVRSEWPMIIRELAYNASMIDSRGLLVTDDTDGMDWDYYDGNKTGEVTAYNDIYYRTLTNAASMADALGLHVQAETFRNAASKLRSAINRYLFDSTTGLYVVSNLQPSAVAQDGNSLAVLFGIAPKAEDPSIMANLTEALPATRYGPLPFSTNAGYRAAVSPFVTNEEVNALFASGDAAQAVSLIRKLWGYMDSPGRDATGTDWELVGADGSPGFGAYTSLAHGWSSGATADLSSEVLGVHPSSPGFRSWSVVPHLGSMPWAEGDVPTPQGPLNVRWAQDRKSGRLTVQVEAPGRTTGTVTLPVPHAGAVVTVHTTGRGKSRQSSRVVGADTGTTSVRVAGGTTVNVEVVSR
jgi:alpha-L-rhamnosidase